MSRVNKDLQLRCCAIFRVVTMLQTRHRPDKENQVHRPPKTPGPGKSIIAKTPFHDENHTNVIRTVKKSVAFGQPDKNDVFQTPGNSGAKCCGNGSSKTDSRRQRFEYATDTISVR
jgi:hypothetical protein